MYVYSQADLKCDDCEGDNYSDDCVRVYFNEDEFLEKCNSADINPNNDCYKEIEAWERKDIDFLDFLKETQTQEICQD
jgi:SPX domain protein involved in polyphosphate accumulation